MKRSKRPNHSRFAAMMRSQEVITTNRCLIIDHCSLGHEKQVVPASSPLPLQWITTTSILIGSNSILTTYISAHFHSNHLSHTVRYITAKLLLAVSICLLACVRFTLAGSLIPLSLNTSTAVAWLPRARSLLGLFTIHLATLYRRRTLRNATINNHTHRQTDTHTHTHTHTGSSMFPLTVGPVSAVSCSIEIVKKKSPFFV